MKSYLLLMAFLLITIGISAQQSFNDTGFEVTRADLSTNVFAKDSVANALVIYETGSSYVDTQTYRLKTEVKRKLKILNKEGFAHAAVELVLYNNKGRKESVKDIKATVYNINGNKVEKTKLSKNQIFEVAEGEHHTRVKFAFPNIKEGSVIVYSYVEDTPFMFNYHGWSFQSSIPKLYSEYNASIPGNWQYNIKLIGEHTFDSKSSEIRNNCLEGAYGASANCADYHYVMKDIPAFVDEDYMTTRSNYLARIEYELKTFQGFDGETTDYTKTWKDTDAEFKKDKNIGRQLAKSNSFKDLLDTSILNESDPFERAKLVYKFVQNNYTWNNEFRLFNEVSVKSLVNEKSGNVSEINILLHNLLEQADIEVKPIVMSTRSNGFPTKIFPVISEFNYLIVKAQINGKNYFLDATDKYLPFGMLPFRCLNHYGRLLDFKNGSQWIDIAPSTKNIVSYRSMLELTNDETLSGFIERKLEGFSAISNTRQYLSNQDNFLEEYESRYPSIDFTSHEILDDLSDTETYNERFNISYPTQKAGDNLYINPFAFIFYDSNPFKLQDRSYPIDFGYEKLYSYSVQLNIGKDYEIVETPKHKLLSLPNNTGLLNLNTVVNEDSIMLLFKFSLNETIYGPEYYEALKNFFSEIIDIEKNSLIVLKRSS